MRHVTKKPKLGGRKRRRPQRGEVERVLARVGAIERVAGRLNDDDAGRAELLQVSRAFLGDLGPIPVSVAANLLSMSEPTVRTWMRRGLLPPADGSGGGVDARRLHEVMAVVDRLRAEGHNRDLLNKVWTLLSDTAVVDRRDLQENLGQMRRGDGIPTNIDDLERELGIAD